MAVTDDLKRVPLFAELDRRALTKLAKRFREHIAPAGSILVREGSEVTPMPAC